jgi:hypothetical protein
MSSPVVSRRLTARQGKALALLADGLTTQQAAPAAGVSQRTVQRWLAEDDLFGQALRTAQDDFVKASLRILGAKAVQAAECVVELMERGDKDDNVRMRAAQDILDRVHGKAAIRIGGVEEDAPPLRIEMVHPAARA